MKKYLFLLSLFTVACSSGDETRQLAQSPPTQCFFFFDKTSSVQVDEPFVSEKYLTLIKRAVTDEIKGQGDQLTVYFVHENTAMGKSLNLVSRTKKWNGAEGLNATDLEAAQTNYQFELKKEQNVFFRQAVAQLKKKNEHNSNRETDLLASIPILSEASSSGHRIVAYFFSDMIQSVNPGRDFHKKPPKDASQAETWASEDSGKFSGANLSGLTVHLALPFEATVSSSQNNPNVMTYWVTLFENLGAITVEE